MQSLASIPSLRGAAVVSASLVFHLVLAGLCRDASACSPPAPQPAYAAIASTLPADGAANVPTNSAVVLDLEHYGAGVPEDVTLSVLEVAGNLPVAGKVGTYFFDRTFAAWRPSSPLRPGTQYQVDAVVRSRAPRPTAAVGPEHVSFTFTTGAAPTPPIEIQGRMEVSLEPYDRPDYTTCDPGKCACTPTARETGTRARVKLPRFTGGQPDRGYDVVVSVTADHPEDFQNGTTTGQHVFANGSATARPGDSPDIVAEGIDDRRGSYRPCFALRVQDVAGNTSVGEPVCLNTTVAATAKLGLGGCQVAQGSGGGVVGPLAVMVLLLVIRRRAPFQMAVRFFLARARRRIR